MGDGMIRLKARLFGSCELSLLRECDMLNYGW